MSKVHRWTNNSQVGAACVTEQSQDGSLDNDVNKTGRGSQTRHNLQENVRE